MADVGRQERRGFWQRRQGQQRFGRKPNGWKRRQSLKQALHPGNILGMVDALGVWVDEWLDEIRRFASLGCFLLLFGLPVLVKESMVNGIMEYFDGKCNTQRVVGHHPSIQGIGW